MTKFSIMNYSSTVLTQPLYFHKFLNSIDDCQSILFPNANDIFLVYDEFQPDYSIINVGAEIDNIVAYNRESKTKVKHILNIDYITHEEAKMVGSFLKGEVKENKLECALVFSSNLAHKNIDFGHPYVNVPNCADTNIDIHPQKFDIDTAVIIERAADKKEYKGSCHFLNTFNTDKTSGADAYTNNFVSAKMFVNYKNIVFRNIDHQNIPEVFWNALYFGNQVYLDVEDKDALANVNSALSKLLKTEINIDYDKKEKYDTKAMREVILAKHSPKNRIKTLFSNVGKLHDVTQKI